MKDARADARSLARLRRGKSRRARRRFRGASNLLVNLVPGDEAHGGWTLAYVLQRYGFKRVARQSYGISADLEVCRDRPIHERESSYVEVIKG